MLVLHLLPLLLGGCVLVDDKYRYGFIAYDGDDVYNTGTRVTVPEAAPSIVQRYQPVVVSKRTEDTAARAHEGFDIIAKRSTPVIAAAPGRVDSSYRGPMYGNQLVIDHGTDEDGVQRKTRYFHLKSRKVRKGDTVSRGQQIGALGATGLLAPNPHLHFETQRVVQAGSLRMLNPVNPHFFWWNGRGEVTCYDAGRDWAGDRFRLTYPVPCRGIPWK